MVDKGPIALDESVAHARHSHAGRYAAVWIALLVLTVVTYSVSRVHLEHGWGVTVALVIALVKGGLVALFFMHLWDQRGANRLVMGTSLLLVALLIGLIIADNATRFRLANPPGSLPGTLPVGGADRDPPPIDERSAQP
jgi:cytochrome c oxidase subunit 4